MNTLAESNVLLPPIDELILGTIAFILVFWALSKFALPGIKKALEHQVGSGDLSALEASTQILVAFAKDTENLFGSH